MQEIRLGIVIGMMLLAVSCGNKIITPESEVTEVEKSDLTARANEWADSICATLTLRQKVAQLFLPAIYAADDIWTLRLVREYADSLVGGVVLLKGNVRNASAIADTLLKYSAIPAFVSIDAEWGLAMRLVDAPEFPAYHDIDVDTDDQLMYDYGRELARECRIIGINVVLGPVLDVSVPGSFMRRRSLGGDSKRVADLAVAYARGLEDGNVLSVAKHFPGHGSVTADSHKRKGVIERSLREMDSIDLYPYRRLIEQRLSGIMVGHLGVPSIDSEMRPAAVSEVVISDLLRDDMHFGGLVFTDALNMNGVSGYNSVDAIEAGADILVAPHRTFREIDRVVEAVETGRLAESGIDSHVRRILFHKFLLTHGVGESEHGSAGVVADSLASPESDSIARRLSPVKNY